MKAHLAIDLMLTSFIYINGRFHSLMFYMIHPYGIYYYARLTGGGLYSLASAIMTSDGRLSTILYFFFYFFFYFKSRDIQTKIIFFCSLKTWKLLNGKQTPAIANGK